MTQHTRSRIPKIIAIILQVICVASIIMLLLNSGAKAMHYHWQWYRIPEHLWFYEDGQWYPGDLIEGLMVTLRISAISLVCTVAIGFITALLRMSNSIVGRGLARGYIEVIRSTPLLVQIYLLYFVFGPVLGIDRITTAILALSLFQGAYSAEIFRAGLQGIPRGQLEAAESLGLSQIDSYRFVVIPQMFRKIIPPLTNEAVSLVKNSSIVSIMAIFDLTSL